MPQYKTDDIVIVAPGITEDRGGRTYPARVLQYPAVFAGRPMVRIVNLETGGSDYLLPSHVRPATQGEIESILAGPDSLEDTHKGLLHGATQRPPMHAEAADAGEFAALWNNATLEERNHWLAGMRHDRDVALACWLESHPSRIEYLTTQQRVTVAPGATV